MQSILVPVDFSPVTTRVVRVASDLALKQKARLVLLHISAPPPVMMSDYYAVAAAELDSLVEEDRRIARRKLAELADKCRGWGVDASTSEVVGQPIPLILQRARSNRAAFIVVGSHGHTAAYDLLVGSTTHGLLRKASCPVVVVPPGRKR